MTSRTCFQCALDALVAFLQFPALSLSVLFPQLFKLLLELFELRIERPTPYFSRPIFWRSFLSLAEKRFLRLGGGS